MMRSRSQSSRGLIDTIRDNPFLCAAFLAGVALAALQSGVGSESLLELIWKVLGVGFRMTAPLAQRLVPEADGWLLIAMQVVIGLIPYLLADVALRRFRNR